MAVKIRLRRMGKRDQAMYRVVVADESEKRDGNVIDTVGWYNPKKAKKLIEQEKVDLWIKKGAQCTDAVKKVLSL